MKKVFTSILVVAMLLQLSSIVFATTNYEPPKYVAIGEMAVTKAVVNINRVQVTATSDNAVSDFYQEKTVFPETLEELFREIAKNRPFVDTSNPEDLIQSTVTLCNYDGEPLFRGNSSFNFEKKRDENGNVSYITPYYAGRMSFYPVADFPIYFGSQVEEAYLTDSLGNKTYLEVDGHIIIVPRWDNDDDYASLTIISDEDEQKYLYDFVTGERLYSVTAKFNIDAYSIEGIRHVEIEDGGLKLEMTPEWNYNPWLEVGDDGYQEIWLHVRSDWNHRPIAVWKTTFFKIRKGIDPEIIPYYDYMELELDGTELIWFEFNNWLHGVEIRNNYYGGGKN
jgi:hypothetical protein